MQTPTAPVKQKAKDNHETPTPQPNPATRKAPLSESIRLGAQLMLQKPVELEVTEFLGRDHYQRSGDGALQGYRNGYEDKQVQTAEGPLHLKMPQVRDTIEAFENEWLRALVRRSDKLAALIPQLYVKGLSTRDSRPPSPTRWRWMG